MGFKLGAFVEGFATQAAEQIQADKKNARDTFKIAYSNWLDKSEEETKTRRTQQKELEEVGSMLKTLNMSDAQALKVLEGGPTLAKTIATQLLEVQMSDPNFNPDDFVKATDESGLTLSDGIQKMMGTLDTSGLGEYKAPVEGNFLFDPQRAIDRERAQLEGAFGMTTDELRAQARGQYTTEELGIEGEVDYSALGITDPMDALRREQLELQIAKLKKGDKKGMKPGDVRSFYSNILPQISGELGVDISYNPDAPEGSKFKTTGGTIQQQNHAMDVARQTVTYLDKLMRDEEYKSIAEATEVAVAHGKGLINPDLITKTKSTQETGAVEQPSAKVDQRGDGAGGASDQEEVQSNYDPATQTPAEFAKAEAERQGLASASNAVEKANIKGSIKLQLKARGVSEDDALKAVRGL